MTDWLTGVPSAPLLLLPRQGYKLFGFTSDNKRGINTLVFNVNILMQLVNEFNGRHLQFTWDLCYGVTGNKSMLPILMLIGGVQFILVQLAYDFVDCVPLSGSQWLGCIIIAALGIPMGWVHQVSPPPAAAADGPPTD